MNKIAKILSAAISVTVALTLAIVMLTSAFAAAKTTFSMNLASQTDDVVVIEVKLESGSFAALDFGIEYNDAKIKGCTEIDYILVKDFIVTAFADTGLFSSAKADGFDQEGAVLATYTFEKVAGAEVSKEDFTMVVTNCNAIDNNAIDYEIINNIPVVEVPVEPETPADPETPDEPETPADPETPDEPEKPADPETPDEPETPADPETPDEPETPADPETPDEPETPADPETPDEPETPADPETPDEPTEAPTDKPVDGDVVNPDTGDSVTATAAICSLLAVSGAAIVALRKKED